MASYKIYFIFLILILTQSIYCRPAEESSEELEIEEAIQEIKAKGTNLEKLVLSNMGYYMLIPQKYATKVVNATKHLLKDETLLDNNEPEVVELKNKLSLFLDKYERSATLKASHETMDYFFTITQPYFEMAEDKQTPASKFINNLFNKYNFSEYSIKMDELEKALDEWRVTSNSAEKLLIFTMDSLITIPQQYAANATNVTRYLLKDEAFVTTDQTKVLEFKNKLTEFLDKYDPSTINKQSIYKSIDAFGNIIDYYLELPEDKVTEESKFIIKLLNKYNCKNVSLPFIKYMKTFFNNLIVILEEQREDLEKPLLDWFEQFKTLTEFHDQMESFEEFAVMIKKSNKNFKEII